MNILHLKSEQSFRKCFDYQGRTQGGLGEGLWLNFPLKFDILQKLDYLCKGH